MWWSHAMKRHSQCLWRILAATPLLYLFSMNSCQADLYRNAADDLNDRADRLEGDNVDLGDYISDLVEDW